MWDLLVGEAERESVIASDPADHIIIIKSDRFHFFLSTFLIYHILGWEFVLRVKKYLTAAAAASWAVGKSLV